MSDLLSKLAEHAAFTHVANNFGHYCAIARRKPVAVTSQGRASIVIIAAEEFERLAALDAPVALYAHELPDNIATALQADDIPAAAEDFNGEYTPR